MHRLFSLGLVVFMLLLISACSVPRMFMIAAEQYNPEHEQFVFKTKAKLLNGQENAQLAYAPKRSGDEKAIIYFLWHGEDKKAQLDLRHIEGRYPEDLDIDDPKIITPTDNNVEKVLINNVESIWPHTGTWVRELIKKSEELPPGEHRIQFEGRNEFNPGYYTFFNTINNYLQNISFSKNVKISFQYDPKHDIYNTSLWLTKAE